MGIKNRNRDENQGQDYIWKPVGMRMSIKDMDRDKNKVRIISGNQFE